MRQRQRWMRLRGRVSWIPAAALAVVMIILTAAGCGEQDLYKPPHSPWQVIGRVTLPSINEDVSVLGDYAYVAGGEAGLHVVNISNPRAPVLVNTINTTKYAGGIKVASVPDHAGVTDIAFVVEGTEGVTSYDITRPDSTYSFNQFANVTDGSNLFIELPANPNDPTVVYLAESWKGLRIYEADPNQPGRLISNDVFSATRGYAKGVSVANGYAYVADDEMGLAVMDVRVRVLGQVKLVSATDTDGKALAVDVKDGYAYIADEKNGLVVMHVNGPDTPIIVGRLSLSGTCRSIMVRDHVAFIAASDGGVHIVDVTDPAAPKLLGSVMTTYATGIALGNSGIVVVSDKVDGLVILGGPGAFRDTTPPSTTEDLTATPVSATQIRLRWSAPGNDLYTGTAAQYDIRYSTSPISDSAAWDGATQSTGEPAPAARGTVQTFDVAGLTRSTTYYFALRAADAAPNWSGTSNVASATTPEGNVPPVLSDGTVAPLVGSPDATLFGFDVTYSDGDGDAPVVSTITIGATTHPLTLVGGDYMSGAHFHYETTFGLGSYTHTFTFDDGQGHVVSTPVANGPYVGESFVMGSPSDETMRHPDETLHTVVLTRRIQVEDHEVTQDEYQQIMGTSPSHFVGAQKPVENVTWFDAIAYCNARSTHDLLSPAYVINANEVTWNRSANGWRLPTEAEWERACRAGTSTAFPLGGVTTDSTLACLDSQGHPEPTLDQLGWYCGNASGSTHDVDQKTANSAGLHDMAGNVWEWCWDWYGPLGNDPALDPAGPDTGTQRVRRGGSWYSYARYCRSASRDAYYPNSKDDVVGFRVVKNTE